MYGGREATDRAKLRGTHTHTHAHTRTHTHARTHNTNLGGDALEEVRGDDCPREHVGNEAAPGHACKHRHKSIKKYVWACKGTRFVLKKSNHTHTHTQVCTHTHTHTSMHTHKYAHTRTHEHTESNGGSRFHVIDKEKERTRKKGGGGGGTHQYGKRDFLSGCPCSE